VKETSGRHVTVELVSSNNMERSPITVELACNSRRSARVAAYIAMSRFDLSCNSKAALYNIELFCKVELSCDITELLCQRKAVLQRYRAVL
jgi:hypothetical protein